MSYQVFARKYRPQVFDDVVGQEHITRTLKNAISQNRLAHAYLFVGPRGIGKTSTARIIAKALCCIHGPTTEPCGVCDPCREIAAGNSLDVLEIDGASNNGVEQVRELRDNVRYAPTRGKYRIYVIDEVHMLSTAAFNALLKTLEEPPEHVKFIFATTEPQKVPATILSRCQRYDLRRIPAPLIAGHLQKIAGLEKIELAPDAADAIARGAEGGLRDAESMLDQLVAFCGSKIAREDVLTIFGFTAPEVVAEMAGAVLDGSTPAALAALDAQSEGGKDLLRLLGELISHLRNLLVCQVNAGSVAAETSPALTEVLRAQAARIAPDRLLELIDQFATAENRMKWAPNKKLHFEIALIKAIQTLGQSTLTEVIDALAALRDGNATPAAPVPPTAPKVAEKPRMDFASLRQAVATPPPPAPVAEVKVPAVPPPEPPPPAAPPPVLDGESIWRALIQEFGPQQPMINAYAAHGRVLSADNGVFRVGFPPAEKMAMELLDKPAKRKVLEGFLAKLAGTPLVLKMELREPDAQPAEAAAVAAPEPVASPAPAAAQDATELFKNDPQIKKALQLFQGEILSVDGPAPANGTVA